MTQNNGIVCDIADVQTELVWNRIRSEQIPDTIANALQQLREKNGPPKACKIVFNKTGDEGGNYVYELTLNINAGKSKEI